MRYPINLCLSKDLLMLSVLLAVIMLHAFYELFRWFCNIFHLKVCAVNCRCTTEWRYCNRFLTRTTCFDIRYNDALEVTSN